MDSVGAFSASVMYSLVICQISIVANIVCVNSLNECEIEKSENVLECSLVSEQYQLSTDIRYGRKSYTLASILTLCFGFIERRRRNLRFALNCTVSCIFECCGLKRDTLTLTRPLPELYYSSTRSYRTVQYIEIFTLYITTLSTSTVY